MTLEETTLPDSQLEKHYFNTTAVDCKPSTLKPTTWTCGKMMLTMKYYSYPWYPISESKHREWVKRFLCAPRGQMSCLLSSKKLQSRPFSPHLVGSSPHDDWPNSGITTRNRGKKESREYERKPPCADGIIASIGSLLLFQRLQLGFLYWAFLRHRREWKDCEKRGWRSIWIPTSPESGTQVRQLCFVSL